MNMKDDFVYAIILLVSVGSGPLIRYAKSPTQKQLLSTLIGIVLVSVTCGVEALHPLIVTLGNCLLILIFGARWCHVVSLVWCFGYLAFFRAAHLFGLPKPHPVTNALQLFNALRMIGVAFEVHDASHMERRSTDTDEVVELKKKHQISPSSIDILHYSMCYIGLYTGPYYKYRTYYDMLHMPVEVNIPIYTTAMRRIKQLPILAVIHLILIQFIELQYVNSPEFPSQPLWWRVFYMCPIFMMARSRLYMAWVLSEVMCVMAGLGAYPVVSKAKCGEGPSDLKALKESKEQDQKNVEFEFETIHNLDIYGCELAPYTRDGLRSWNMSVQYWLASNIHRRIPRHLPGGLRVAITMAVSAFWHGIHPGYFLSFLTVPLILAAEDMMIAAFRRGSATQRLCFDWACWFFKMRGFEYTCMGFLLLTYDTTIGYWTNIYFIAHIVSVVFIVIGIVFKPRKSKKEE